MNVINLFQDDMHQKLKWKQQTKAQKNKERARNRATENAKEKQIKFANIYNIGIFRSK